MLKNELMKKTDLRKDTIRHYERIGLLEPVRLHNGYLDYPESSVDRIELVKHAKSLGMTLREITDLIVPWENNEFSTEEKVKIFKDQLSEINKKILDLENTRSYLTNKLQHLVGSNLTRLPSSDRLQNSA